MFSFFKKKKTNVNLSKAHLLYKPSNAKKKIEISARTDDIKSFFYVMLRKHRNTVCSPSIFYNTSSMGNGGTVRISRTWNVSTNISKLRFDKCLNSNKRFIAIFLQLPGHANALIYDKKNGELEWFEPHGEIYTHNNIVQKVVNLFNEKFGLPITEIISSHSCPRPGGVQGLEVQNKKFVNQILVEFGDPINGLCFYWTVWYLDMKFSNPNLDSRAVLNKFIKEKKINFYTFIRDYIILKRSINRKLNYRNVRRQLLKNYPISVSLSNIKNVIDKSNLSTIKTNSDVMKLLEKTKLNVGNNKYKINININDSESWRLYQTFITYLTFKLKGQNINIKNVYKNSSNNINFWKERFYNLNNAMISNKLQNKVPNINELTNIRNFTKKDLIKIIKKNNPTANVENKTKMELIEIILNKKNVLFSKKYLKN